MFAIGRNRIYFSVLLWAVLMSAALGAQEVVDPALPAPGWDAPATPLAGSGVRYVVSATIPVGTNPYRAVMTPNGQEVYVTNTSSGSVSVISTVTNAVTNTVTVGTSPYAIAAHPDGSKVYVGCMGGGVYVIDTATKAATLISVGSPVNDLSISNSGDRLYLAMEFGGLRKVVTATSAVSTISGTVCPEGVVFVPKTTKAYVNYQCSPPPGSGGNDPVYEFNATTDAYVTGFTVGPPHVGSNAISASPDGSKIWACGSGTVKVVRTSDNVKLATLTGGYTTVSPDSARAYVPDGTNLGVYDAATFALVDTIPLAASGSLAFNASGCRFYAPVPGANAVKVVDLCYTGGTSFTDTGLTPNTAYSYYIVAKNGCGTSLAGPCATSTTAPPAPAAPAAPSFTAVGSTTLTVNWTAVSGATSYNVWRAAGGTCTGAASVATGVAGTSFGDSGLTCGTQYSYYVVAVNGCGNSTNGACGAVTTVCAPGENSPGSTSANAQSWAADKTTMSWQSDAAATGYRLYRGTPANLPNLLSATVDSCTRYDGVATSFNLNGVNDAPAAGSFLWFLVTAYNGGGEGPAGNATAGPRTVNSSGVCP